MSPANPTTGNTVTVAFSGVANLCTKTTAVNATSQTTGGVYNVTSSLVRNLPAFQPAAQYTAVM